MAKILAKAIDISDYQPNVDWAKVKKAGYTHVILKIGAGDLVSQKDSCFEKHYKNAKAAGFKIGGYWYSYCTIDAESSDDVTDAKLEAKACLACIKGKTFDLPIYYDLEDSALQSKGKTRLTKIATTFCDAIKAGGYVPGVYGNWNWFNNYLDYKTLKSKYSIWYAQYGVSAPEMACDIWQYSESGKVSGISGTDVDLDNMYKVEFKPTPTPTPTPEKIAYVKMKMQLAADGYKVRVGVMNNVQRILKECGYNVAVTGKHDAKTKTALKKYQKKFGLKVTGNLNAETALSLFSCEKL